MSEVNELYQEMILEHNQKPRNFGVLLNPTHKAEGFNPLCGDRITLQLLVDHDTIKDIRFQGSGCAISKASTSLMTTAVKGRTKREAEELVEAFRDMLNREKNSAFDEKKLGKLAVFSGVCEFPARIKCANLAWHTLLAGLENKTGAVSTEGDSKS